MKLSKITAIILAVVMIFCAIPAYALDSGDGESRVYFYDVAGNGAANGDFIIVESNGRFGLIDTGHRYSDEITDENGDVLPAPSALGLSSQVEYKNALDAVEYMVNTMGITHLDFIIGTHSHSDHIGGVPEISSYTFEQNGEGKHLVDSSTVYFYKSFRHINNKTDDLEEYSDSSWHSQAFYYQAVSSMSARGARLFELSKGVVISEEAEPILDYSAELSLFNGTALSAAKYYKGEPDDYYDDYILFTFGDLQLRLYNLFSYPSVIDENVNSVVVTITDGQSKIASMTDINVENRAEQKLAKIISDDLGRIDLLKVPHHGAKYGSNTRELYDCFKPKYAAVTRGISDVTGENQSGAYSLAMKYAKSTYNTVFYEVGASDFALGALFTDDGLELFNLAGKGDTAHFERADGCVNNMTYQNGWSRWDTLWGETYEYDYYYFENNKLKTGWLIDGDYIYYLCDDGRMARGWQNIDGEWFFFNGNGIMRTGWAEINGSWYYFNSDGVMRTGWLYSSDGWYYFNQSGVMQTGWQKLEGKWYYFGEDGKTVTGWAEIDGKYYYFDKNNDYCTGWNKISGKWYYFSSTGVMQTGWLRQSGKWYYLGDTGAITTGWSQINDKWYYFKSDGAMATVWNKIGKKWYCFGTDGVMLTGWVKYSGSWYYLDKYGAMKVGWAEIDGNWYYFNSSGVMQTKPLTFRGKEYKFTKGGVCLNP